MKKLSFYILTILSCTSFSQSLQWAKSIGGYFDDGPSSMSVDHQGNVYTTGGFNTWVDFDPGIGTYTLNANGGGATPDIFISKLDANGHFKWAKCIGSTGADVGIGTTVDKDGNLYTTGIFSGTVDFDPGTNVYNLTATGTQDIYINKFDSTGNFLWAKRVGGTSSGNHYIYSSSMTCDANGNVYTTGYFMGWADFNVGTGTDILSSSGSYDLFVLKLDTDGNYGWAKKAGGPGDDQASCISLGKSGCIYLSGNFDGTSDFDTGPGIYNLSSTSSFSDIFTLKLDNTGNFIWAKGIGNSGYDHSNSIAVDASENVYTTGYFTGTVDFDPGAANYNLLTNTYGDVFISKLDSSGNFIWARQMGGSNVDTGSSIKLDSLANVYVTGYYSGNGQYLQGAITYTMANAGGADSYILKLDSSGNYLYSQSFGGTQDDFGRTIAIDDNQNVHICGNYNATADFDPGTSVFNLTSNGDLDIFILKFGTPVTGINDKMSALVVNLYPNPNSGDFKIEAREIMKLELVDNLGQIIQSIELNRENNFHQSIHVLHSGIYFISGQSSKGSINHKIIVTR
jgi:hypothetical protein